MISDDHLNPFNLDPAREFPHQIENVPNWTEHYFFYGYDARERHGMCVHIGRLPADPSIWRAVIQVYLPGEELLVAKYHGRDGDGRGAGAGPFKLDCIEPMRCWTARFDGAMHATTRTALARGLLVDGPAEPVSFQMLFEAAGPYYGPSESDHTDDGRSSGSFHTEQILRMRGEIRYRGKVISLSGVGARDHSSGPRDYGPVISDMWIHGLFPSGKLFHAHIVRFEGAEVVGAYVFRNDGSPIEQVKILEHPPVNTADAPLASLPSDPLRVNGGNYRLVLGTESGEEVYEIEMLHSHIITYRAPMEELIGTDFTPGGVQMCEAPMLVRCGGEEGVGLYERVARTETLFVLE
ncbi:MAG: hypothetical protein WC997_00570 [Porticoccaceae bacterium]